jgi:hypothetical protein
VAAQLPSADESPEALNADRSPADMLVPVYARPGRARAVVEMDETKARDPKHRVEAAEGSAHPAKAVHPLAGGMGVAGVEAYAEALVAGEQVEDGGQLLPVCAHLGSAAGGVLEQELEALGNVGEQGAKACRYPPHSAGPALAHVMADVEDDEARSEEGGAAHVVGHAVERAGAQRGVGRGEVDEIAGVNYQRGHIAAQKPLAEGLYLCLWINAAAPAPGAAREDLEALTAQAACALCSANEAGANRDMDSDAHVPVCPLGAAYQARPSQPRISSGAGLWTPTKRETTPPAALASSAASP